MDYVEQMQKQWLCENRWHMTCGYASPAKQNTQILKQYILNLEDTKLFSHENYLVSINAI
ncbi:hypothetical protein Hanom_Chr11g00999951 [Helianthus anomalus]